MLTEDEVESPQIPFSHFFLLLGYSDPLTHFLPFSLFLLLLLAVLVILLGYSVSPPFFLITLLFAASWVLF